MRLMRDLICISILMLLFLLFPIVSMAGDSSSGIIKGKVINNTLDGKGVEGLEIILYGFVDGKELELGRTKTDSPGYFSFQGISVDKKIVYYITTKYKEVEYFSQPIGFEDKKTLTLDLIVYETTGQDTDIYAKMHHIFLEIKGDSLWIKELMIVENRGDMVYVGHKELEPGKKETLRISLPKEAANIKYIDGLMSCCVVKTEEGFSDTMEVKPGAKKILFSYTVNYKGSSYQFKKGIPLKTDNIDFFFPDKGIKVKSNHLEFKGTLGDSAGRFSHLSGKNFPNGSQIIVEFSGLPRTKNLFKWVIAGLVIVLIGSGFAIPFIKRGQYQDKGDGQTSEPNMTSLYEQKQAVLQTIAELDDLSESGGVNSEEYQIKRAELLKKAVEITKQLKLSS